MAEASAGLAKEPEVLSLDPIHIGDVVEDLNRIGRATGTESKAAEITAGLTARIEKVAERAKDADHQPSVLHVEWADPVMCGGHWVPEVTELAGGTNSFGDKEGLVFALISERGPSSLPLQTLADAETFEDKIAAFVTGVLQIIEDQRDLFGLVVAPDPITRRAFQRMKANHGDLPLASLLEAAELPPEIDPRVALSSLMGMIIGNAVIRPIPFGEEVADRAVLAEQITRLFIKGVS